MKTSELIKYIKKHGCILKRNGSGHDLWINPKNGNITSIPRHGSKEIPKGTSEKILKDLGLK